jgi:hypothetical protein
MSFARVSKEEETHLIPNLYSINKCNYYIINGYIS